MKRKKILKIFIVFNLFVLFTGISFAENFVTCDTPFSSPIINVTDPSGNTQFLFDDNSGNILYYKPLNQIIFGTSNKIYSSRKDYSSSTELSKSGVLYTSHNEIKTLLFGTDGKIYSKNFNVFDGAQAWCPSDGWINTVNNPYSTTSNGHYCYNTYFEEDRNYSCNYGNEPKSGICNFEQIATYDCRLKTTYDRDGGKNLATAGYVYDYEKCGSIDGCYGYMYYDKDNGDDTITEYFAVEESHNSITISCKDYYDGYYCDGYNSYDDAGTWDIREKDVFCYTDPTTEITFCQKAAYCNDLTGTFYDGEVKENCLETLWAEVSGEEDLSPTSPGYDSYVYCDGYNKVTKSVTCNGGDAISGGASGDRCPIVTTVNTCNSYCNGHWYCTWYSTSCIYNSTTEGTTWYKKWNCASSYHDCDDSHVIGECVI